MLFFFVFFSVFDSAICPSYFGKTGASWKEPWVKRNSAFYIYTHTYIYIHIHIYYIHTYCVCIYIYCNILRIYCKFCFTYTILYYVIYQRGYVHKYPRIIKPKFTKDSLHQNCQSRTCHELPYLYQINCLQMFFPRLQVLALLPRRVSNRLGVGPGPKAIVEVHQARHFCDTTCGAEFFERGWADGSWYRRCWQRAWNWTSNEFM